MFYSHEILTNTDYGVATVWLVSTIGLRSTTRKISRKAIQEVNVRKACQTILQPTAPIALRLQGSLLYGLSRVYSQQCHYVLTDAERVQAHMRAFYNALGGNDNALDPQAGKSRRKELILEDDPEFDLRIDLPAFHFDDEGNLVAPQGSQSQASRKTSSQLSPMQPDGFSSSSNRSFHAAFDLSQSPMGGGNFLVDEHFGAGSMTPGKGNNELMPFGDEERQLQAFDDWGIMIDDQGNVIETVEEPVEEPQLPQRPRPEVEEGAAPVHQDEFVHVDDQGDVIMSGDGYAIPSDPPIPPQLEQEQGQEPQRKEQEVAMEDEVSSGQAPVRVKRQRRRPKMEPDDQTKITRQELRSWAANYLDNAERASQPRHGVTATEARKNAFNLIFGRGIAGIGFPTGIPDLPHPLASHFAGDGLQARLLGIIIENPNGEAELPRGRRRPALEALELEGEGDERRVRRRLSEENEDDQLQAAQQDDAAPIFNDEDLLPVEVGRRGGSALPDDIPSDLPWNRQSSQIPSSSIKGAGSKPPSRQVSASPLHNHNLGPEIERFSDQPVYGSDGFDSGFAPVLHSGGSAANNSHSDPVLLPPYPQEPDTTSEAMRKALDRGGAEFLSLIKTTAHENGGPSSSAAPSRQWVDFDSLFERPEGQKREAVVKAFYHVLTLATKNVLKVKQDGQGGTKPFGTIRLGVDMTGEDNEGGEM